MPLILQSVNHVINSHSYALDKLAIVEIDLEKYTWFKMYLCISVLLMQPETENLWITKSNTRKKLDPRNTHEKKILDPYNTHEGTMAVNPR